MRHSSPSDTSGIVVFDAEKFGKTFTFVDIIPWIFLINPFEPERDKTNKMTCAPSEDSDQPGHPPSLSRVFDVCSMGSYGPKVSSCGHSKDSDQTGRMPRMIWDFAGPTDHFVGFVVRRLIYYRNITLSLLYLSTILNLWMVICWTQKETQHFWNVISSWILVKVYMINISYSFLLFLYHIRHKTYVIRELTLYGISIRIYNYNASIFEWKKKCRIFSQFSSLKWGHSNSVLSAGEILMKDNTEILKCGVMVGDNIAKTQKCVKAHWES